MTDRRTRRLLAQLPVEPRSETFFEELWEEIGTRERQRARKWRTLAVAALVATIAAASTNVVTAMTSAEKAIDVTMRCGMANFEERPGFFIQAQPLLALPANASPKVKAPSASVAVVTPFPGEQKADYLYPTGQLLFDTGHTGYIIDRSHCRNAPQIPFARTGLPVRKVFKKGYFKGLFLACESTAPLVFRVRLAQDSQGVPAKATLVVRAGKRLTPVLFATWTPQSVVAYQTASAKCESR